GRWAHLEAEPFVRWCPTEVDAGYQELEASGECAKPLREIGGHVPGEDYCPTPGGVGVTVIVGGTLDARAEHLIADDVGTIVNAGDVRLELGGAPAHVCQPLTVVIAQTGDDTPDAAYRLVDDAAVALAEFLYGIRVGGNERLGSAEAELFDPARLVGLGIV